MIDHRPKAADIPDPGPIANAEAHLDSISRGMAGIAAHAAVARLIEYTRLLEHARIPEPEKTTPADEWRDFYSTIRAAK